MTSPGGFQFPPPVRSRAGFDGSPGFRDGKPGGEFIIPPATGGSAEEEAYEAARALGEKLAQWGDTADWAAETVFNHGQVLVDYGDELKNKVESWAVPTIQPLSQTINRRADPTFQLSDFMVPPMRGRSDTENHNHTHITTTEAHQLQRGGNTKNRVYLAFLTPAINRAYTQLNFMVSEVVNPCRMDVAVYVVDEDRQMHRQVLQTAISPGLGESVAAVTFPRWVATQGSYLAVAWLQTGSGNSRYILGLDDTPRPLPNVVFPRKISAIHTSTSLSSLPATITGTLQADFAFWFTPYAELSEDVGVDYRVFTEPWGHGGVPPRPWVHLTSNGIYSRTDGSVDARGITSRTSMYDTPLSTDYVRVRTSVARTYDRNCGSIIIFRGTNNLRSGLGLLVNDQHVYRLISWANVDPGEIWRTSNHTVVHSLGASPVAGHQIEIDYMGGLVTVRINGTVLGQDLPMGGPAGAAGRFVGLHLRRYDVITFINYAPSPNFGPWSARDLPQDDGGDDGDSGTGEDD